MTSYDQSHRLRLRISAPSTLSAALVACCILVPVAARIVSAQSTTAGDDLRVYGEMFRKYDQLYGVALQNLDDELRVLRSNGATPGELQQAYERFRKISLNLDERYKQPVVEKMLQEANRRVAKHGTITEGPIDPRRPVGPSTPIESTSGTKAGDENYRPWGADTDAGGGSRAVDHIERVASEMGLTADDGNRLFSRTPSYSTSDNERLQMTIHKSGALDRVGSNAWQTQIEVDALQPETAVHVNMREGQVCREYVAARDHQTKAIPGLQARGSDLLPRSGQGVNLAGATKLQGMVKGTLKSLDVAELSDEALAKLIEKHGIGESPKKLKNVLKVLKTGMALTPDAAGITVENIGKFQALCGEIIDESLQVTKAKADFELDEKIAERNRLEASGDKAEREKAQKIREEIVDSRKRMQEVERATTRSEIDDLQQKRDAIAAPADEGKPTVAGDPDTDAAKRQKIAAIDNEIEVRRAKEAMRDLYADVERRKTVRGATVVADLDEPQIRRPQNQPKFRSAGDLTEVPPTQRESLLTHPAVSRGLLIGGGVVATYHGLKEEYYEAEQRLRQKLKGTPDENRRLTFDEVMGEISYTRSAMRTALSLTGIEGAWMAGQKAKYEWVKGTNDYIADEVERYRRAGYDDLPLGATLTIMMKATIRQTTMTAYEGTKGVPLIGDLVGFPENLYVVTESTVGILYDRWKRDQILSFNAERAIKDARRAAVTVRKLLRDMENLIAAAGKQTEALEALRKQSLEAERQKEALRDQFRLDLQSLETLTAEIGEESLATVAPPDTAQIGKLLNEIATFLRESQEFVLKCDRLERSLETGQIDCSTIRERDRDLDAELVTLGYHRDNINSAYAELQKTMQSLGPAADARKLLLRLRETTVSAGRISENLTQTAGAVKQLTENLRTLRANLDLVRERVMDIHEKFSPRAAPGEDAAEWDSFLRRADDARIDIEAGKYAGAIEERLTATAAHLGLISRTELPQLPVALEARRIGGDLTADLENVQRLLADVAKGYDNAKDKLDGLRQLCPAPKPVFKLAAKTGEDMKVSLELSGPDPAAKAKRMYVWEFGDEAREASPTASRTHLYQKPGEYTVAVRVFEESDTFSAEIGTATVNVKIAEMPATPTPPTAGVKGPVVFTVSPVVKLDGEADIGDPQGNNWDPFLQNKPVGAYTNYSATKLRHVPGSDKIEAEVCERISVKVRKSPFGNRYELEAKGTARGQIDPRTGNFRIPLRSIAWTQKYPNPNIAFPPTAPPPPVTPEQQAEMESVVLGVLGGPPGRLGWSGEMTGTVDWQSFGGGQGRIELNHIFRGNWKFQAGYPYQMEWPNTLPRPPGNYLIVRFFPTTEASQRTFLGRSRSGSVGTQRVTAKEVGDEAMFYRDRLVLVRFGRWHLDLGPGNTNPPEQIQPFVEQLQQFVRDNGLDR